MPQTSDFSPRASIALPRRAKKSNHDPGHGHGAADPVRILGQKEEGKEEIGRLSRKALYRKKNRDCFEATNRVVQAAG